MLTTRGPGALPWAGARGPVPALAEVAARKGASSFVRTARALHEQLLDGQGQATMRARA